MKLSLMILNLTTDIFLDKDFSPKKTPDWDGYEKVLKMAHDAGYKAIDLTDMECACFGAQKVKESMEKYDLACGSMILFENFTCTDVKEQKRVQEHTKKAIDHSASLGCHTMMLVAAGAQPGLTREELQSGLVDNLAAACAYATTKNVTICVEDFPSTAIPMCAAKDKMTESRQQDHC